MNRPTLIMLSALVAFACSREQTETKPGSVGAPTAAAPEPAAQAATGAEPDTKVPQDQLPTAQDYEDEAEQKLTSANLDLELDQLEAEIED